jgi:hypothetical protein
MNQFDERELHQHVVVVAWLNIAVNALFLLLGLCTFLFFAGIGAIAASNGHPTALAVLSIIGTASLVFFAVLTVPWLVAGYGLLHRARWGQILGIVLGFLSLFNFPVGTIVGAYTLFVLLQNSATTYFAAAESE